MNHTKTPANTASRVGSFGRDVLASVVVFLVALPLCMGIAMASGVPAENAATAGIVSGVVGGVVVGLLGGSPLQVSGPAAGLSVVVFELTRQHGWEKVGLVTLLAGAFQLVAGLLKLGQWFRAVSPAVVQGMLAGIGVLIVASQFHIMVDDQPRRGGLANLLSIPDAVRKGVVPSEASHDDAARLGLVTIALMVMWKPLVPRPLKVIPAPLIAVTVATAGAILLDLPVKRMAVPDNLLDVIRLREWDGGGRWDLWRTLLPAGLAVAVIASAETLLCAAAVDQVNRGPRTRYDRELAAQGIGNMLCGLLGALPITGVIVRSAANVEAGARSRASAVLHGCWLLVVVYLFPSILRCVPTASLAAILVYTGYKLINPKAARVLITYGRGEFVIYLATVAVIVATDLLTGVLVGTGLAMAKLLHTFTRLKLRLFEEDSGRRTVLLLRGAATFLRLPMLATVLDEVRPNTELHVHLEDLEYIDHACLELLMAWEKRHESTGGRLVVDWDSLTARFHSRDARRRPQRVR
jgi:MFS superfamily sulfate permease-like transporter